MSAAPPTLVYDAAFEEARERRAHDRRSSDRLASDDSGIRLDPLFAATLVNHVAAPERFIVKGYRAESPLRAGIAINVSA